MAYGQEIRPTWVVSHLRQLATGPVERLGPKRLETLVSGVAQVGKVPIALDRAQQRVVVVGGRVHGSGPDARRDQDGADPAAAGPGRQGPRSVGRNQVGP